jgi:hypothetical protein
MDPSKLVTLEGDRATGSDGRMYSPAAARNRDPILAVLKKVLPREGVVLEIGAGTGEHAIHFAAAFPQVTWQPTDPDRASRESIAAWIAASGLETVRAPLDLNVALPAWANVPEHVDAIVSLNMIHIAPWSATLGLFAGAGRHLLSGKPLFVYGPFMRDGAHTAPSNADFDRSLKSRNPEWGVRDIADLVRLGKEHGLELAETFDMPANNMSLVFRRTS